MIAPHSLKTPTLMKHIPQCTDLLEILNSCDCIHSDKHQYKRLGPIHTNIFAARERVAHIIIKFINHNLADKT